VRWRANDNLGYRESANPLEIGSCKRITEHAADWRHTGDEQRRE
jgi:hypothetical protein